eukprot:1768294-Pleurochrysis_carterae.AAC.1
MWMQSNVFTPTPTATGKTGSSRPRPRLRSSIPFRTPAPSSSSSAPAAASKIELSAPRPQCSQISRRSSSTSQTPCPGSRAPPTAEPPPFPATAALSQQASATHSSE